MAGVLAQVGAPLMEFFIAFLVGAMVGASAGVVVMGLLLATREEVQRYR